MIFNRQKLLENVGGSEELLEEMILLFMDDAAGGYEKLKQAIGEENLDQIIDAAHAAKGASQSLNAENYASVVEKIELAAREGKLDIIKKYEPQFDEMYKKLVSILKEELEN